MTPEPASRGRCCPFAAGPGESLRPADLGGVFGSDVTVDPLPAYTALRRPRPPHPVAMPSGATAWLVSRHEDVVAVLTDPRVVMVPEGMLAAYAPAGVASPAELASLTPTLFRTDGTTHARQRRALGNPFGNRRVEALRPRVKEIAHTLLDDITPHGRADLIADFALPLPAMVICELLGVPGRHREEFLERALRSRQVLPTDAAARAQVLADRRVYHTFLADLLDNKRRRPGTDLLTDLGKSLRHGLLNPTEIVGIVGSLLQAGYETVGHLLGNGVLSLLCHTGQWQRLRADPSLVAGTVDELLRHAGPVVSATLRRATVDVDLPGGRIPAGDLVFPILAATAHDQVPEAAPRRPALQFGRGAHRCVGVRLTSVQTETALTALLQRLPELAIAVPPQALVWQRHIFVQGLRELPVTFTPTPRLSPI